MNGNRVSQNQWKVNGNVFSVIFIEMVIPGNIRKKCLVFNLNNYDVKMSFTSSVDYKQFNRLKENIGFFTTLKATSFYTVTSSLVVLFDLLSF